jgi:prevent-host-death family protein
MKRHPRIATDIKPVSDFRANAAGMIEQVKASGRPLVLTQRGESAAVLLDVAVYQELIEELELLSDIRTSMKRIDEVIASRIVMRRQNSGRGSLVENRLVAAPSRVPLRSGE